MPFNLRKVLPCSMSRRVHSHQVLSDSRKEKLRSALCWSLMGCCTNLSRLECKKKYALLLASYRAVQSHDFSSSSSSTSSSSSSSSPSSSSFGLLEPWARWQGAAGWSRRRWEQTPGFHCFLWNQHRQQLVTEWKIRHVFLDVKVHPAIASSELVLFRRTPNTVWHSCVFVIEKSL